MKPTNFDNSFKNWFSIMWGNWYIQLFAINFGIVIAELFNMNYVITTIGDNYSSDGWPGALFTVMGFITPWLAAFAIAYLGFYRFWKRLKNGDE